jgi:DNA polymerase-4
LRRLSAETLHGLFGEHGDHLWQLAHGIDDRQVVPDRAAKSISHETTFAVDITDMETLQAWLLHLAEQVAWRLRQHALTATTVQIKVRYGDFHTVTRAQSLPEPSCITQEIWQTAARLLSERLPPRRLNIRLLGVGVTGLSPANSKQTTLFLDEQREAQTRLDQTLDGIRHRFGRTSLTRGSELERGKESD